MKLPYIEALEIELKKAAARVEALEAALREALNYIEQSCGLHASSIVSNIRATLDKDAGLSEQQRKLDASVSAEQAAEYIRKERERNANRDKPIPPPRDGFINDYD